MRCQPNVNNTLSVEKEAVSAGKVNGSIKQLTREESK